MKSLSLTLACLVLLTACVSCQDPSGTEEIDENEDCNKPSISDGETSPNTASISSGAAYTATCNSGYTLVGPAQITCIDGDLSAVPGCTEDCNKPSIPDGETSPNTASISSGAAYTATCNAGYTLVGPAQITCIDGDLSAVPECTGPSITIWKGKCRKGTTVLCRVKCTVELVSGTAEKKHIAWIKKISGGIDTIVPNGKMKDGVYTSIIPGPDPLGDYYCRYNDPISSVAFDSETDITITNDPPPVIVIADVRSVTCVELSDCEISCSAAALNFKTKDETKLKFDKADPNGNYQLIAKQGILDKKRAILRWEKDDGGVNIGDSGFYKCEYDGSRSSDAISLSVTPVCYKPANPPNGQFIFKRKAKDTIDIGETYTVKCDKNTLMTGNDQMTCSGTNNFPGELTPAPTCTPRSVTATSDTVSCKVGSYCEISCRIEGIAEKTDKKGELYIPTKKARWSWLKKATTFDSIRWHGRSALDNKVMTYKFKSVSFGDTGEYKCAYDFGKLKPDVRESGVINLIAN